MRKRILIFIIIIGSIWLSFCKKYPEDPLVPFPSSNIFAGVNHYASITIDGKDVTELYSDSVGINLREVVISIGKYDRYYDITHYMRHEGVNYDFYVYAYKTVSFQKAGNFDEIKGKSLANLYEHSWEIRRRIGVLVLQTEKNGKIYRITYLKR